MADRFARLTAQEAASLIKHGDNLGCSGFTPSGSPKAIPMALAERAVIDHLYDRPFKVGVLTGASTGNFLDGALAKADAISFRTPYQTNDELRRRINDGSCRFVDMHLSLVPQFVRYGFLGRIDWAIIEAADVTDDGEIILTSGVGAAPTYAAVADKILIEINRAHPVELRGIHDIYEPQSPPHRRELPIYKVSDRIGAPFIKVDPKKIVGVVETNFEDDSRALGEAGELHKKIGQHVAEFLANEMKVGRIPSGFLPLQSGVGETANGILGMVGTHPDIPPFEMYTEVLQDSVIALMKDEKCRFASTCSLSVSTELLREIYSNLDWYKQRVVLRPQEISNNPEAIRRLGLISMNTAIEVDIFGNVNSTHVMGSTMMNGIGGSGDFTRNAYISIFTCPSTAKGGKISTIVPQVSHADHSEHSVQVVATEWGIVDLRGRTPLERARLIVDNCAHPEYRDQLHRYFDFVKSGHTPQTMAAAYAFHVQFLKTGDMRGIDWKKALA
ncbi:MAG: succinate CoA transferase [Bryobacterales bacterium]|nr:succinate CoA transferase [Bryobacterales bacterium]